MTNSTSDLSVLVGSKVKLTRVSFDQQATLHSVHTVAAVTLEDKRLMLYVISESGATLKKGFEEVAFLQEYVGRIQRFNAGK